MYVVMCEVISKVYVQSGIINYIDDFKYVRVNRVGYILWKFYCVDVFNCYWNIVGECLIYCFKKFLCFFFEVLLSFLVYFIFEILKYIDYFIFMMKFIKLKFVEGFIVLIFNLL